MLLSAGLLSALAWLTVSAPRMVPSPTAPLPPRSATVPPSPTDPATRTLGRVLHGADTGMALRAAERSLGRDHPEIERVRTLIDQACAVPTTLRLDGRRAPDARRDPARVALEQRCAGMPQPSLFVPTADTDSPLRQEESAHVDAGLAMDALRTADTRRSLVEAWLRAYRSGALPQEQIFPDQRRLLPGEAEAVILVVAHWHECARLDACGPESLLTLEVCALHGCPPGSDLRQAWHEALSPRDFEAVEAVHAWLRRLQSTAP